VSTDYFAIHLQWLRMASYNPLHSSQVHPLLASLRLVLKIHDRGQRQIHCQQKEREKGGKRHGLHMRDRMSYLTGNVDK